MVEKDKITEEKVKFSGIFEFKDTYQFVYNWLVDEDYTVEEEKYSETISGDTKGIEINWKATKKVSDYFRNEIKLGWRIIGMSNVEVEKNGKKIKMNKGNIELKIVGSLSRDYMGKWDSNASMKFLRGGYDKYIIEGTMKGYNGKVFGDVSMIAEQLKAFLAIEGLK